MKINIRDIVIGVLALVLAFGLFEYHQESLQLQAMNLTIKQQQASIDKFQKEMETRDKELKSTLAQLEKVRKEAKTPQQVVEQIPKFLPELPKPIHVNTIPSPTNPNIQIPDSITIPKEDFQAFLNFEITAKENAEKLKVAEQDIATLKLQIVSLTKQRDAAVKTAKGGSFWHRLKHDVKVAAIGAAVAAVAILVH